MTRQSPFDHRPDPELGALLKDVLTQSGESEFTSALMAEAARYELLGPVPVDWWEVLRAWSKPGLVAALLLLLAVALFEQRSAPSVDVAVTVEEALEADNGTQAPPWLLTSPEPPEGDLVLAALFE